MPWRLPLLLMVPAISALAQEPAAFSFNALNERSLELLEGGRPVLVYNHGKIEAPEGVPADRARACYVHPLYGLDGEVLTDDFPKDHYHHRGLFWVWPHVRIGEEEVDLWLIKGIEQRFERWLEKSTDEKQALLAVQNGWYVGDRKVMDEVVRLTVHRVDADGQGRAIDCAFTWTPTDRAITLEGAEGKSYGGFTLRYAPGDDTAITAPAGLTRDDLLETPMPWADLTRTWTKEKLRSGAAILVPPEHPDYPPTWLTRHYGVLCLGWPGVKPRTFPAGEPIHVRYRVWIHRGQPDAARLGSVHAAYAAEK